MGRGARKTVMMSRYACYLVIQNADPAKEIVAHGQQVTTHTPATGTARLGRDSGRRAWRFEVALGKVVPI